MEAVIYFIIGIMGFSILFSIVGLIITYTMNKNEHSQASLAS